MNQTLILKLTFSKKSVFWLHRRSSHYPWPEVHWWDCCNSWFLPYLHLHQSFLLQLVKEF